jgi:hypothetical protein
MSFKVFIYYCALCGGWAAFLVAVIAIVTGIHNPRAPDVVWRVGVIGGLLGMFVGGAVGAMDALLNAVGSQRITRVLLCIGIGLVGGLIGGFLAEGLHQIGLPIVLAWMLVGVFIGVSVGAFDLLRAFREKEDTRVPLKKTLNGVYGGLIGGAVGGLPFAVLLALEGLPRSGLIFGLVLLGSAIGLMIALAQVFLKEAWLKVEAGFRAGREVMLTKEETTIGRAESCDIGLFRDNTIEKLHARIKLEANRYVLADANTPAGTYLNDQKVVKPMPLKNGDLIRVGNSELRFGERQQR